MKEIEFVQANHQWAEPYNYSAAAVVGDYIFASGQVAVDEQGEIVGEGDFLKQAHQVLRNVQQLLGAAGASMAEVAKVTIFLVNADDFAHIPGLRSQYFQTPYPADTTVIVESLARPGLLIEVEVIAVKTGRHSS